MSAVHQAEGLKQSGLPSIAILAICLVVCFAAAGIGSLLTTPNIPGWYENLVKPPFNPPNWIFAPVWTALFALMAIAMWRVWIRATGSTRRKATIAFAIQLALNIGWSAAFFAAHAPGLAIFVIIALLVAIAATIRLFYPVDRPASWMLAPYFAWVSFATLLNVSIFALN
ncbi:tryptophan-rich sensory protein [Kaistia dalseonensis]|uniref:Tryptophan-rich sensory protein n=1 Tax=Kaistia dalseonensis TaxID=410840 RepID=A0ABU0H4B4_9HYPH|nr:TspO/MBR family protein [Kaistia dalseonensis]MCX5494571.1 tryptophan-rich sensory protein [Kaistia dalseonensis]MDQ0437151.1 tryptophan-rich sensory protein [Kaistia dalseonensis]